MKNNISDIVKNTLLERYELESNFNLILENEKTSDDEKFEKILDVIIDLEKKGLTSEQIDEQISGDSTIGKWIKKFLTPGADKSSTERGVDFDGGPEDYKQKLGSAFASQLREYLISFALGRLGFKGRLKESISTFLADVNYQYIIAMFRGGKNCIGYAPPVADAFTEGVIAYMWSDIEERSILGSTPRNIIGEYIRGSQLGEKLAEVICEVIPKRN